MTDNEFSNTTIHMLLKVQPDNTQSHAAFFSLSVFAMSTALNHVGNTWKEFPVCANDDLAAFAATE